MSVAALSFIVDPANAIFVSPATYWEIAIKLSSGKYIFAVSFAEFVQRAIHDNGFTILPIEPYHCEPLVSLPPHHKDPFDRLLIAQAMAENIPIITVDPVFDNYPVTRLW